MQPTIPTGISDDNPVRYWGVFEPVPVLFRAKDEKEAVRIANDTPFGLGVRYLLSMRAMVPKWQREPLNNGLAVARFRTRRACKDVFRGPKANFHRPGIVIP